MLLQQDAPLLDVSVRHNLCLGHAFSDAELHAAIEQAELNHWFSALPNGFDTRLGNRGTRCSGGERHRLALARVFLRHPRIILFDETTAALDDTLEATIWATVNRLFKQQTLIVVSHREPPLPKLSHSLQLSNTEWQWRAMP